MGRYQRGALSLLWCAILVGLVTALALAGLFSMRYERNFFAEGWDYVKSTTAGKTVQRVPALETVLKGQEKGLGTVQDSGQNAALRKCTINGAVVYSNVDCRSDNPTSRTVELHDSRGFEPPKMPVAAAPQTGPADNLRQKAMDKAIDKASGNQAE